MKRSFLGHNKPLVTAMIENTSLQGCLTDMRISLHDGADAFAIDLAMVDNKCREKESVRRLIECTSLPIMIFTYRNYLLETATDDDRATLQLQAAELGVTCCDVMGDLFDPSPTQLTNDNTAVCKQKDLISKIHTYGAEVIMSSHIKEPVTAEYALEHMSRMAERGADIAKLIAYANTPEDFSCAVETTVILKKKLPIPFIYLCSGRYGPMHRYISPMLGSIVTFTAPRYTERVKGYQPLTLKTRQTIDDLIRSFEYRP